MKKIIAEFKKVLPLIIAGILLYLTPLAFINVCYLSIGYLAFLILEDDTFKNRINKKSYRYSFMRLIFIVYYNVEESLKNYNILWKHGFPFCICLLLFIVSFYGIPFFSVVGSLLASKRKVLSFNRL